MYINSRGQKPLVLASASPRRRDLLEQAGVKFEVIPPKTLEKPLHGADPAEEAKRIALEKAEWVAERRPGAGRFLAADTLVVIEGSILGKPRDEGDACGMLGRLSGRWHTVVTGWHLISPDRNSPRNGAAASRVLLKRLDDAHIRAYVNSGEPMDKAGAYAAQGVGACLVERIEGSYTNVVGLPLCQVIQALEEAGAIQLAG